MNIKIELTDVDPRIDQVPTLRRIEDYMDKCDPGDRLVITIEVQRS